MTIDSREIIKKMIDGNGSYPGDPQAYSIHTYINSWGARSFHVSMTHLDEWNLFTSPYCANIELLWDKFGGPQENNVRKYLEVHLPS